MADKGSRMEFEGKDLLSVSTEELIELRRHRMGMVFQHFALLPHLSVLNNIVSYAYGDEGEHWIDVHVELDRERLSVTVEDEGHPFNPFARSAPDTTLSMEEREIGGLGIHLVRKMMDEVSYVRRTGRNVVIVVKHLAADETPSK